MSKPISDGQIYGLMWAEQSSTGMFSELFHPPHAITIPGQPRARDVRLLRTAFDRSQLLGLAKRGLMRDAGHGCWAITDAGRAELRRPAIVRRIELMADATAEDDRRSYIELMADATAEDDRRSYIELMADATAEDDRRSRED